MWKKKSLQSGGFREGRSGYSKHNILFALQVKTLQAFEVLKCDSGVTIETYVESRSHPKVLFHIFYRSLFETAVFIYSSVYH